MPEPIQTSVATKLFARIFSPEGLWGLGGCAMACASGGFALYMTMNVPAASPTSHDFPLFASVSARSHRQKLDPAIAGPQPQAIPAEDIDPVVTGSIPDPASPAGQRAREALRATDGQKRILSNVVLRQVDGDSALVEINDSLGVYKIGDQIPGAGRFMALTSQNGRPAIETSTGYILEGR